MSDITYSRDLARRMAFGAPFDRTVRDAALAQKLASGSLELAPHKPWKVPPALTWTENPFREPNWIAQFHMLRWLDPLRREAEAGHHANVDVWLAIAESWIKHNPPGRGKAQYAWADMVEAARALTFCFALPIIEDLRPDRLDAILGSLQQHGDWLADPAHIRRGNHALQQHQGLLVIGAVLERPEWVSLATTRSALMLAESYDEQGINEEGAVQYHQINFMWWRNMKKRIEILDGTVPEEFDRIVLAPVGMAHATRPDGRYELIGDTEEFAPRGLGHSAIDYVSSAGAHGSPPEERVKVYDAGYVFGRSSWGTAEEAFSNTTFYSIRFGPQNRIHGHVDGMALTLYADNAPLLVDSGKYAYDATDPYRAHLLSREAHNSLSVAGRDYDKTAVVRLTQHHLSDETEHFRFEDTGYDGVVLQRDVVVASRRRLVFVLDGFEAEGDVNMTQRWHLNPDAGHRREGASIFAKSPQNSLRLAWTEAAAGRITVSKGTKMPIQGWFSPTWRALVPTRVIAAGFVGAEGSLPTVLNFADAVQPLSLTEVTGRSAESRTFHVRRGESESFSVTVTDDRVQLVDGLQ